MNLLNDSRRNTTNTRDNNINSTTWVLYLLKTLRLVSTIASCFLCAVILLHFYFASTCTLQEFVVGGTGTGSGGGINSLYDQSPSSPHSSSSMSGVNNNNIAGAVTSSTKPTSIISSSTDKKETTEEETTTYLSSDFTPLKAYLHVRKFMTQILGNETVEKEDDRSGEWTFRIRDETINNKQVQEYMSKVLKELPKPKNIQKVYTRSKMIWKTTRTTDEDNDIGFTPHIQQSKNSIVTLGFVNADFFKSGLVQNWLCSLKRLDVTNFVLVAIDQEAANLAAALPEDVISSTAVHWDPSFWNLPGSDNDDDEQQSSLSGQLRSSTSVTNIYLEFTWRRNRYVKALLEEYPNLDIIISDVDTAWNHVPWEKVPAYLDYNDRNDLSSNSNHPQQPQQQRQSRLRRTAASDKSSSSSLLSSFSTNTIPCDMFVTDTHEEGQYGDKLAPVDKAFVQGGFIMLHNTPRVRHMYDVWVTMALIFHQKEQPALRIAFDHDVVKHEFIPTTNWRDNNKNQHKQEDDAKSKLNMCIVDRDQFPTTRDIFGNLSGKGDLKETPYYKRNGTFEKAVIIHPTLRDKTMKPVVLRRVHQWYWDEDEQTCTIPTPSHIPVDDYTSKNKKHKRHTHE